VALGGLDSHGEVTAMRRWLLWAPLVLAAALPAPARAVEYRLLVASVQEQGVTAYLPARVGQGTGEVTLPGLEAALDAGRFPRGVLLPGREARRGDAALVRAFGAVTVSEVPVPSGPPGLWQEIRWEGTPGQRSLWVIAPRLNDFQEVYHLALGAGGPARYVIPYAGNGAPRRAAMTLPLALLSADGPGDLWQSRLAPVVDLSGGLAVIVGTHSDLTTADHVFLLVEHPREARTFKAVIAWRPRPQQDPRVQPSGVER